MSSDDGLLLMLFLFILIYSLPIVVLIIAIIIAIKIADKKDPGGNAKRIIKKIIIMLCGISFIVVFNIATLRFLPSILSRTPIIALVITACIFGPIRGCIIGFFGNMIASFIEYILFSNYDILYWLKIFCAYYVPMSLYCFIIGIVWQKHASNANKINISNIMIFCLIQYLCYILLSIIYSIIYHFDDSIDYLKEESIYHLIQTIIIGVILYIHIKSKKNKVRPPRHITGL